ncbi:SMC domain protein [Nostoc commune NIES-4072]|uniref:SMC domain protein n=1 Tax=Nostoc commune NIES-4072 TaxID=2005467 RepID=A0A2R5FH67_NOSCO|nr:AAA family ATPase [Nostoc commune]BBD65477.1 SMC domain protein [Nostoc commune HK-02]GBG17199.1 SMC domain protein [Nostoc commune NIES-4072]
MNRLQRLTLNGFKSIKAMDLELHPLNILIGANGAGKSNLISFFKMLNEMMAGRFQQYIGMSGRAQSLLHFGPKITPQIEAKLEFEVENGVDTYNLRLFHAAGDTLIFAEETLSFLQMGWTSPRIDQLGAGHQETKISEAAEEGKQTARTLKYLLDRCRVYHFHDTSSTAEVRQSSYVGDNRWLMPDAGNLAALLLKFREDNFSAYQRIIGTIRLIAPFFDDFVLEPDASNRVILNWQEKDSDRVFGPHQFSDGTLRAMCLATLLLQPEDKLPELIVVDEPELGLHPYALNVVAGLFSKASLHTQILISTQSSSFLDNFDPEDVIAVNREGKESQFKRLNPTELEAWLDEYTLGEVWEKNIIGGGPH